MPGSNALHRLVTASETLAELVVGTVGKKIPEWPAQSITIKLQRKALTANRLWRSEQPGKLLDVPRGGRGWRGAAGPPAGRGGVRSAL